MNRCLADLWKLNASFHAVLIKVLRIPDILVRIQIRIRGSVPLTYGIFQDTSKKFLFACYILKVNFYKSSMIKRHKETTKQL
jgi:hypothetical protein